MKKQFNELVEKYGKNKVYAGVGAIGVAVLGIAYAVVSQTPSAPQSDVFEVKKGIVMELGEEVSMKPEAFLTEKSSPKGVQVASDLITNKEKYTYDATKQTVVSKDKKYLEVGNYEVSLKKEEQEKKTSFEVKDTKAPTFKDFKDIITIEQNAENVELKDYFEAEDLSEVSIDVQADGFNLSQVGEYKGKVFATDKYGNKAEKDVTFNVVSSEQAKEEGVSETEDGEKPLSAQTQQEVNSGQATVGTNNQSSSNVSQNKTTPAPQPSAPKTNTSKPKQTASTPKQPTCKQVAKTGQKKVVDQAAWTEQKPIYESVTHAICNNCGADITGNTTGHMKNSLLNGGKCGSYHAEYVDTIVGYETINHPEVSHMESYTYYETVCN